MAKRKKSKRGGFTVNRNTIIRSPATSRAEYYQPRVYGFGEMLFATALGGVLGFVAYKEYLKWKAKQPPPNPTGGGTGTGTGGGLVVNTEGCKPVLEKVNLSPSLGNYPVYRKEILIHG